MKEVSLVALNFLSFILWVAKLKKKIYWIYIKTTFDKKRPMQKFLPSVK